MPSPCLIHIPVHARAVHTVRTARLARWLAAALAPWLLAGCGAFKLPAFLDFSGTKVRWDQVTLAASADANRNSAVAVDLVLVTDPAVFEKIVELPSSKWFAARRDLAKTYPQVLTVHSWETVPGQHITVDGSRLNGQRVAGALVFADYLTPGTHRVRIDRFDGRLIVRLEADDVSVAPAPAP